MKTFFKNPNTLCWVFSSLFFCVLLTGNAAAEERYHRMETILHLHSRYSFRGTLTPEEIVQKAREKGIEALIFTDHALVKISYGPFPFRRLLKFSVEESSVSQKGVRRYFQEIEGLNRKYPDRVMIPSVEVAPFYYWERPPLTGHGVVRDWNKHLLVLGLDQKKIRSLPLMGHGNVSLKPFHFKDLVRIWGGLACLLGFLCFRRRTSDYRDEMGRAVGPPSRFFRGVGWVLILVGILSLIENYPYRKSAYTLYGPEGKMLPYQKLIEDVQKKGGLVFWAHPEAKTIPYTFGPVTFLTDPYPEALLETTGYTGFSIFFEGFKTIGVAGGIWDQLLLSYCRGERPHPVWAIGELDYSEDGRSGTWIDTVKNIVFSKEKTPQALLDAFRNGRVVALRRTKEGEIRFHAFWLEDAHTGRRARLGETLFLKTAPRINFCFSAKGSVAPVEIRLIRDGEVIQEWKESLPVGKAYEDAAFPGGFSYYRLEVRSGNGELLVTNPIFVSRTR